MISMREVIDSREGLTETTSEEILIKLGFHQKSHKAIKECVTRSYDQKDNLILKEDKKW
jgi:hypothetical protein